MLLLLLLLSVFCLQRVQRRSEYRGPLTGALQNWPRADPGFQNEIFDFQKLGPRVLTRRVLGVPASAPRPRVPVQWCCAEWCRTLKTQICVFWGRSCLRAPGNPSGGGRRADRGLYSEIFDSRELGPRVQRRRVLGVPAPAPRLGYP